jgi:prophage regulatory protein
MVSAILRLPAVMLKTSLSKSSIYRLESLDKFPKRVRIGENSTGWLSSEIDEFIASRPRVSNSPKAVA